MSMTVNEVTAASRSVTDRDRAQVRFWLYAICVLVFAMVIVGGATRLTDSGLSITEWQPLLGAIPPLNAQDWQLAFEKYKLIPEYQLINKGMSLAEFKFIYWWEWAHRFLGRFVGLAFFVPMVWFWATGKLEKGIRGKLVFLLLLGGLQGFIGWWMVSSGLAERVDVSQYRLAVHLTLANLIFAWCLWIARGLAPHSDEHASERVRSFAPLVVFALFVQIFWGALVAGMDAGLAFNDWPLMDGAVLPGGLWVQEPFWINLFENPKMVQFTHRLFAYLLVILIVLQMVVALGSDSGNTHKRRTVLLVGFALLQASFGVITLVMQVPLFWGLVHQGGATLLLGAAIAHWRGIHGEYRRP